MDGLAAAGGAPIDDLASGRSVSTAVTDGDKSINQDHKLDKGDHLVVKKKESEK